jgi:excisionase family DNA binding protein
MRAKDTEIDDYPVWMSTDEAARYLGVSNRTLHVVLIPDGLPVYRIGRVFRFKLDDVRACVESLRVDGQQSTKGGGQ